MIRLGNRPKTSQHLFRGTVRNWYSRQNRNASGSHTDRFHLVFFGGLIINPISELDFFPEPYVFYIVSVFATALLFMVGLSFIWTIFDNHWWTIIIDGDNVALKRYLPLKINSFSYKQLKSTDIEMVVMERVWVEHTDHTHDNY